MKRGALVAVCCLGLSGSLAGQAAPKAPAEPRMSVLLETDAIGANAVVPTHAWIENPDTIPLSSATTLRWVGPSFLHLGTMTGSACVWSTRPLEIPVVPARSAASLDLCISSDRVVVEGTFSIGFVLLYGRGEAAPTSYLLVEKTLRVGLLGSDTVAGVSLRLASFVVPGLLFFFLLQLRGVLAPSALDALRLATFSVVYSILLSGIAAWLYPPLQVRGTSVTRFIVLCAAGAASALALSSIRQRAMAAATRRKVGLADSELTALGKALRSAKPRNGPFTLTLTSGRELIGATAAPRVEGGTALLGWFEIELPAGHSAHPELGSLKKLQAEGDYCRLLERAHGLGLTPVPVNGLLERVDGKLRNVSGSPQIERFAAADVQALVQGAIQDIGQAGITQQGPIRVQ